MARPTGTKLIAENRRARYDYELLERFEAGIALVGTEVKSLRDGRVTLAFREVPPSAIPVPVNGPATAFWRTSERECR